MSVGVMEDYKLRDLRASHTLGYKMRDTCLSFIIITREGTVSAGNSYFQT
jgi:hypothetical protein